MTRNIPYKAIGYTIFAVIMLIITILQYGIQEELNDSSQFNMGGVTIAGGKPFTLCDDKSNCIQPFKLINDEFSEIHFFEIATIGFSAMMAIVEWKNHKHKKKSTSIIKFGTKGVVSSVFAVISLVVGIAFYLHSSDLSLTAIATAVGVGVTIITVYYQNLSQQTTGLIKAFDILNGHEQRNSRKNICKAYAIRVRGTRYSWKDFEDNKLPKNNIMDPQYSEEYGEINNQVKPEELEKDIHKVCADLDQIGTLIINGLIPKTAFLDAYWATTIRCWGALEKYIDDKRSKNEIPHFMHNFSTLKKIALEYWREQHSDDKIMYY